MVSSAAGAAVPASSGGSTVPFTRAPGVAEDLLDLGIGCLPEVLVVQPYCPEWVGLEEAHDLVRLA